MKKRINININDYKKYSEKYTPIEIEIRPVDNKYGQFINYKIGIDNFYHHIYFNNNKEEIKRNYINEGEQINIIKIIIDYQIKSFENLFYNCDCIESIKFYKFYRKNINKMSCMFSGCSSLKELDLNNFNTNKVTDMRCMFYKCSSLTNINLSKFDTQNVIAMNYMFYGCKSLKKLDLNNFNTNKVIEMRCIFSGCSLLKN